MEININGLYKEILDGSKKIKVLGSDVADYFKGHFCMEIDEFSPLWKSMKVDSLMLASCGMIGGYQVEGIKGAITYGAIGGWCGFMLPVATNIGVFALGVLGISGYELLKSGSDYISSIDERAKDLPNNDDL